MATISCKSCGAKLALPEDITGQLCQCVRCGAVFVAPNPGSATPAAAASAPAAPALRTTDRLDPARATARAKDPRFVGRRFGREDDLLSGRRLALLIPVLLGLLAWACATDRSAARIGFVGLLLWVWLVIAAAGVVIGCWRSLRGIAGHQARDRAEPPTPADRPGE
jgi:hypothetical protein